MSSIAYSSIAYSFGNLLGYGVMAYIGYRVIRHFRKAKKK